MIASHVCNFLRTSATGWCVGGGLVMAVAIAFNTVQAVEPEPMSAAVRAAAQRVLPAVVTIEPISAGDSQTGDVQADAPVCGLVIDPGGYILAPSMTVDSGAAALLVTLPSGDRFAAEVIARDEHRDLAMLKISPEREIDAVRLSPERIDLPIGSTTVAVARYNASVTPMIATGILSAIDRLDGVAVQTDARISPSFYGGPLVDLHGRVLGILIPAVGEAGASSATDWYDSGVAFAIDASAIAGKLERLKNGTDIHKGLLGIVASSNDPNDTNTALSAVRPRSPAEAAGLKAGDVVRQINDTPVPRFGAIRQALGRFDAGETVAVTVERDGAEQTFEVVLAETIPPLSPQRIGIAARDVADGDDQTGRVVVTAVVPKSPADGKLEVGDRLLAIQRDGNAEPIAGTKSLAAQLLVADEQSALTVNIRRGEESRSVSITTANIADQTTFSFPDPWIEKGNKWIATALDLPTAAGVAAIVGPAVQDEEDSEDETPPSLLIWLLDSSSDDPIAIAKTWSEDAAKSGVAVCVIRPTSPKGWQIQELETIESMIAAVEKRFPVGSVAVAPKSIVESKSTSADRMAIAAAVSLVGKIDGVAISSDTQPPAIRMRENSAAAPLQVLLPMSAGDEPPAFAAPMRAAGYPLISAGQISREKLLRWTRLLQSF